MGKESGPQQLMINAADYELFDGAVRDQFGAPIQRLSDRETRLEALQVGFTEIASARIESIFADPPSHLAPHKNMNGLASPSPIDKQSQQLVYALMRGIKRRLDREGRDIEIYVKPNESADDEDSTETKSGTPELITKITP